jgi:hypothetical protein
LTSFCKDDEIGRFGAGSVNDGDPDLSFELSAIGNDEALRMPGAPIGDDHLIGHETL